MFIALVTFGYGSFSTASQAVVFGYLSGVAPTPTPPDTHDLPLRHDDWQRYRDKLRRQQADIQRREAEKIAQAAELRREIDEIRNPTPKEAPKNATHPKKAEGTPLLAVTQDGLSRKQALRIQSILSQIQSALAEAELLAEQAHLLKSEERRRQDEEDITVIDRLLTAQIATALGKPKIFH